MRIKRNTLPGVTIAPLMAPIVYVLFVMIFVPDTTPKQERTWEAAFAVLVLLIPASYLISFALGAPLIYVLKRVNNLYFWPVVIMSVPLGIFGVVIILLVIHAFGATVDWNLLIRQDILSLLTTGAILGLIVSVTFCLLAGITRR